MKLRLKLLFLILKIVKIIPAIRILVHKLSVFFAKSLGSEKEYLDDLASRVDVDLIIDVGVYEGTPLLYEAFSDVPYFLVDPMPEFLKERPGEYRQFPIAFADKVGEREFLEYESGGVSSFYEMTYGGRSYESAVKSRKTVNVETLDSFLDKECINFKKIGIKIDAQGAELDILDGLSQHSTSKIVFFIIENNIIDRYRTGSDLSSVTSKLLPLGFRFLNIAEPTTPYPQYALDCIYLNENDDFYKNY